MRETVARYVVQRRIRCGVDMFYESGRRDESEQCADKFVELHRCMVKHSEEFQEFARSGETQKREGPTQV